MTATLVQWAAGTWSFVIGATVTLPAPPTVGNLLVLVTSRPNGPGDLTGVSNGAVTVPFTAFAAGVSIRLGDAAGPDGLAFGYRIADGSEQTLHGNNKTKMVLYEFSNFGSPSGYSVSRLTNQAGSTTKTLPALSVPGDIQLAAFIVDEGTPPTETAGTGYAQDDQDAYSISGHPLQFIERGTAGATPSETGVNANWGGIAVGITSATAVVADFSGTPLRGAATLSVAFTDLSTGSPTSWSWTFGDGGTSTSQNPSHSYTTPGTYTVVLVASKTGSSSTKTRTAYVVVIPPAAAGVYIDWDGDGFATGAHDDVSANVISWTIVRGSGPELTGSTQAGTCTLVLKNPADIYNPFNASGPLYGKLTDGQKVWIGVNSDGALSGSDPRGLFAGRILDITPILVGGASVAPTVEITFEDFLGWAARVPVRLDYAEGRSHGALRKAALDYVGGITYSLDNEIETMPLSHADASLLAVLEDINRVTGTRHFAQPADNFSDWFTYVTRNRFWRLDGTVDSSVDAGSQHVTGSDGWRLSADTVINEQRATVEPLVFTPSDFTVWQAQPLPFDVTVARPYSTWVTFDDVVRNPVLDIASTGAIITPVLTPFATTAKVDITVASGTATVSALSITGRLVRRAPAESYQADNATSQGGVRGIRSGSEISGEYLGVLPEAQGIAEHIVWRFGTPQIRPTMTVENWFPDQFDRDLYDVLGVTIAEAAMSGHHFEIVGLTHTGELAAATAKHHTTKYVLQESPVQSNPGWFVLDSSLLDGTDHLAY